MEIEWKKVRFKKKPCQNKREAQILCNRYYYEYNSHIKSLMELESKLQALKNKWNVKPRKTAIEIVP